MKYILDIGEEKVLVLEDYGNDNKYLKISIEDTKGGSTITVGICLKSELKRMGKSL